VIASLKSVKQHTQFNPERQKEVAALRNQVRDLISRSTSLYSTMLESKDLSQQTQVAAGAVARDNKEVEAALIELQKKLSNDFQQQLKAVTELSQRQRFLALITFILAGLCAAGLAVMVERQVSVPLRNLTMRLKDIAEGEGDLTKRLEIANHDELGEVSSCFNQFMEKIQDVIRRVAENTTQLAGASEEISATATHSAESIKVQADRPSKSPAPCRRWQ
jgi:methyl-accepting chemotaxis protein